MKKLTWISAILFVVSLSLYFFVRPHTLYSVPPTNVKDSLTSSQLSYFARIGAGTTAGDTFIKINTVGNPSRTTANLFPGDTVGIALNAGNGLTNFIVKDIGNTAAFEIDQALPAANAAVSNYIVATRSAQHFVSFTPQSSIASGHWQFLIKATNRAGENQQDGLPDQQGFDFGLTVTGSGGTGVGARLTAADVTCPWGMTASVGNTAVVTIAAGTATYHVIDCALGAGATNPIGVGATITVGRPLTLGAQLINPSPSTNHVEGQADASGPDVYTFFVRHLDGSNNVIDFDTVQGKIAVIDAVRITATVDPTITFTIDAPVAVGAGQTRCGVVMSGGAANTTGTAVAFGSISIGVSGNDVAQRLSCLTNGASYAITAYEQDVLRNIGDTSAFIPDTNCSPGSCNPSTTATWGDTSLSKFGYSQEMISAGVSLAIGTTANAFNARPFGIGYTSAVTIMSRNATPASTDQSYICYRVTASTAQKAGNYETDVIYTATATF